MEEQQTGMATPSDQPSTAQTPAEIKALVSEPNRKQRRARAGYERKMKTISKIASNKRLDHFHVLTSWQDANAKSRKPLSTDQADSVFRVALSKLFKEKFETTQEFKVQLTAIIRNVKKGFKYKSDVAPTPRPIVAEETAPAVEA